MPPFFRLLKELGNRNLPGDQLECVLRPRQPQYLFHRAVKALGSGQGLGQDRPQPCVVDLLQARLQSELEAGQWGSGVRGWRDALAVKPLSRRRSSGRLSSISLWVRAT